MAIYQVQAPDGKLLEIEAPEGADQSSILSYARDVAYPEYLKQQQESEKEAFPALRAAADVPVSFARGATSGVRMISDFFGADNPVSQNLIGVENYLESLMSAQSRKDAQEISRIMKDAEDKGVLEQVKAGIKAFTVAPVDILTNAFGTAAPTIAAGLAASTLAPAAAVGTGALTAGRVAAGAVGAVSGAGTIKGTIYNDVKQALLEQNVPEDVAEETAVRAQSYNGENLDSILAGGAIGTLASVTGLEPTAVRGILGRIITTSAAKETAEETAAKAGAGAIARGAVAEAAPEAIQAGQEQLASNVALQREGMDVPTMRGVAGAAALEGVVGGILGGAARGLEGRPEEAAKTDEDAALKEALDVFNQNQKAKGLGPILQIEDMTGNRILAFANENREKIPVLGQILDSGIPRDIKIEQIKKRLADLPQYAAPTEIGMVGPRALPAPPKEGTVVSAPEAFATAIKANVPITDLRVQQGPEGYRVVNESGQVITQQVRTEREANVLMEALRRENDVRNTDIYQQNVKAYEQERLPVVTEAVARAAREVQTPITGYPMADVKAVDEGLFNAIREARKGKRLKADATPEEIAKLNPSEAVMNELNIKQKPVTGGGAAIRPEYETEILGPRPMAPFATARSAEQLKQSTEKVPGRIGRKKVMFAPSLAGAEVTQTQPLSQFERPKMVTLYRSSGMMDPGPNVERWTTDKETARRFGPIREVSIPQDMVERFSRPYEGGGRQELLFDKGGRTPMQIASQMPVSQQGLEQEYSVVPEEDMARAPKAAAKPAAKPAKKKREVIQNVLKPEKGEAPPAGFRPAEGKQPRQERGTYTLPPEATTTAPTPEAVAEAEKVINARIDRVAKQGEQGKKIAEGLRTALESGDFTPEQMLIAFKMSDISARLLGTTAAAPHDYKFFNAIINTKTGSKAYGVRDFEVGAVKLATVPEVLTKGRDTAAHEAFHVLQDLFNEYDKPAARIIRDAFRGAVTVDNISPDLLRKLKSIRDPESGKTYDQLVKENIGNLYRDASPLKRERELQAYVFAALEDARSKGVSVQSFGGAFTRFLNFISDFKMRLRNYLDGRGYRTAADLFEQIGRGEAQRGLGVSTERSGAKIIQRGKYEPEDLSRAAEQTGENVEEFKKWWKNSKIVDKNGNPMRYYHGTMKNFRRFKDTNYGAYFFAPSPKNANIFSKDPTGEYVEGSNIIPVYISAQNPFDFENPEQVKRILDRLKEKGLFGAYWSDGIREGDWSILENENVQKAIKDLGHDGFYTYEFGKNIAVYEPSQIKSVFNRFEPGAAVSEDFSAIPEDLSTSKNWPSTKWVEKLYEKYPEFPFGRERQFAIPYGEDERGEATSFVTASIKPRSKNEAFISWFSAYPLREGVGTKGLQEIVKAADQDGIKLSLSPWEKGQVSKSALKNFYKKNGFKEDKKTGNMVRDPLTLPKKEVEDMSEVSEDISEATVEDINATGQGPAVEANSNTFTKTWDYVREFFNPFALVTNQPLLFQFRNKMYGSIAMSEDRARKVSDALAKANSADREATYKYLTTRNADPATIADPKVRAAAQEAKAAINKIGAELVDKKFMTQESYDTFYDQYLPRIYLYHQMTGRGMTTPLGGVSKMEYIMKRKDLSKEERDLLGEIKDPAFLAYVAMARPARDLAMSEYLTNLASFSDLGGKSSPWVLPKSVIEWNGRKITPYALLAEASDIRQFVLPVAQQHDPEQARIILANLNKMEEVGNRGMAELKVIERDKSFDTTKYEQMPNDKRYGYLAGAIIQKGIYNDLVGTFIPFQVENRPLLMRMMGDENSLLSRATGLWKLGKTTLNIPTQVRNFVSNMIALTLFTDINVVRLPGLFKRALVEITNESQNWKDAQEYGITGGTMSSAELRGIFERTLQRINKYDDNKNENPLIKAYAMSRIAASTVVEKAGDIYQRAEVLFKFMAFLNERQKQGFVRKPSLISDAVNVANDALFDYTLVNPNIRWVRNAPIGLPFITYFYKVVPKLIETAYKHPMRFAPYIALATALPLYTMSELDLTPEELESMRKTLPEFIREKGSLYFLPYRDEKGNIMYVDLAPFFPWSSLTDPFYKMYKGDVVGGLGASLDPIQPGGPIVAAIAVAATGVDPFTRKPVMDPRDTPTAQAMSMVSYIWNQAMPPMFSVNLNDMDQSSGAIPRVYNSLFVDGTGVDKRGLPKPDAVNTAARLLGFNATPLMADMQRAANVNYMLSQIRKRESYRSEIAKNQAMTLEKRRAKIAEINEQIKEDYIKLRDYGTETAAAAGVAQRVRQQTEEE